MSSNSVIFEGKEFKSIPLEGWRGYYVSAEGEVLSYRKPNSTEFCSTPKKLKGSIRRNGYTAYKTGCGRNEYTQALVLAAWVGPRPEGYHINHIDRDRAKNRLDNLEYVTPLQNTIHSQRAGAWSQLTDADVLDIVDMYEEGDYKQEDLANIFGVSQKMISLIVRGENWSWLTGIKPTT